MIESWRRLAKAGSGQALVHQFAQAFLGEGRWPLFALAQRFGDQVKLIAASQGGTNCPVSDYPLELSPCGLLYKQAVATETMVFCTNLRPFLSWPLLQQFDARCYVAMKVDVPATIGEFHILLLDRVSRQERELPRTMMAVAAQRIGDDILRQAEKHELNALRQMILQGSHASAVITPVGLLDYASRGMAELLGLSIEQTCHQPFNALFQFDSKTNIHQLLATNKAQRFTTWVNRQHAKPEMMTVELTPLPNSLGHLIRLIPSPDRTKEISNRNPMLSQEQLADRLQQEKARIHRNGQVAAMIFIGVHHQINVSREQWSELAGGLSALLRSEDLIAKLDRNDLAILTACFDHQGKAPRQQMNAIANKLYNKAQQWLQSHGLPSALLFRARLITAWDNDLEHILRPEMATEWKPEQIGVENSVHGRHIS